MEAGGGLFSKGGSLAALRALHGRPSPALAGRLTLRADRGRCARTVAVMAARRLPPRTACECGRG